ncbi:MAG: hypothetical protein KBH86_01450 [Syntrophorhabdus sp.]|nr:hypothetical protein [Syntrophorhabdus sp.]
MNRLKGIVLAGVILFMGIIVVSAADFKVYPGAKVDEKLTKEANDFAARSAAGSKMAAPKATIYTTGDAYEKVYSFYKSVGKEYQMPGTSGRKNTLPSGKELKSSFFIFDGAIDLMSSKLWIKIQRPYIDTEMREGPDMTYIIVSTKN